MGKLTATAVKNAKPKDKPYKKFDGDGLFLLIQPDGKKYWRWRYTFTGKQRELSMGVYPRVSLADARKKAESARDTLYEGIDPSHKRKMDKRKQQLLVEHTFERVAREWLERKTEEWKPTNTTLVTGHLERNIFPWIGDRPIAEITPPELLQVLRMIENRGAVEVCARMRSTCGAIFRYAVACGIAERDITADLRGALKPRRRNHRPAIVDPEGFGQLLRAIDSLEGSLIVRTALQLLPHVFIRPGELRKGEWSEINWEAEQWEIPAERMKMDIPHIVPLTRQSLKILESLYPLTCQSKYIFPSLRSAKRPISDMALTTALRRLGYEQGTHTPHGFRASARTLLDEVLRERIDIIEHQLAHNVRDALGRAYNRTTHIEARREMMQRWSDYIEELKSTLLRSND
jgi:integrase